MIIALVSQFHIYLLWIETSLVGAFNQEKTLVPFSVIRKLIIKPMDVF